MRLLVHCCCAPDGTAIARVAGDFAVSTFFYNPNIHPLDEYALRHSEMEKVNRHFGVEEIAAPYDPDRWKACIKGHENNLEKGDRCRLCYAMRLQETARVAKEQGFEAFTTVLSASPHKVTNWIMEEGEAAARAHGIQFLARDFKQKDGYAETLRFSKELGLYRQDYCGCIYSLWQRREEDEVRKGYRERLKERLREHLPAFKLRLLVKREGLVLLVARGDRLELPQDFVLPGEKIRQALKRIAVENHFTFEAARPGETQEVIQGSHWVIQTYEAAFKAGQEGFQGVWCQPGHLPAGQFQEWDRLLLYKS